MEGEVEAVAVAGDIMWEEIKSGEDNVGWCADGEGEFVDDEMRRGEEGFMVIITSQIDSFRASMRTVVLIKVVQELILLV